MCLDAKSQIRDALWIMSLIVVIAFCFIIITSFQKNFQKDTLPYNISNQGLSAESTISNSIDYYDIVGKISGLAALVIIAIWIFYKLEGRG